MDKVVDMVKQDTVWIIIGISVIACISLYAVPAKAEIIIPTAISALAGIAGVKGQRASQRATDVQPPTNGGAK